MLINSAVAQLLTLLYVFRVVPAGRMAFDSATSSVVRNEDKKDGGAWGTARLKFDFVAMAHILGVFLR